jgi:Na+/glutamate symporter
MVVMLAYLWLLVVGIVVLTIIKDFAKTNVVRRHIDVWILTYSTGWLMAITWISIKTVLGV